MFPSDSSPCGARGSFQGFWGLARVCLVCAAQNKARPLVDCAVFSGTQERDVPRRWPLQLPMGRAWGPGEDLRWIRRARARPAEARAREPARCSVCASSAVKSPRMYPLCPRPRSVSSALPTRAYVYLSHCKEYIQCVNERAIKPLCSHLCALTISMQSAINDGLGTPR